MVALTLLGVVLAGCATSPANRTGAEPGVLSVVAAEGFWGSLAAQLGGEHARVRSIIDNPDADPHDYEAATADGRALVSARLTVVNGVGYDTWASRLTASSPDRDRVDLVRRRPRRRPARRQPAPLVRPGRRAHRHRRADHRATSGSTRRMPVTSPGSGTPC